MLTYRQYLAEDEQRVDPKSFNLSTLYTQLNHQYFNGELDPHIPIQWGKTPKGVSGITKYIVVGVPGQALTRNTKPGTITITINPYRWEPNDLSGVVTHEMIHAFNAQYNRHERDSHGNYFMAKLYQIQARAPFKIPKKDESDHYDDVTPKPAVFLCGMNAQGKELVTLYSRGAITRQQDYQVGCVLPKTLVDVLRWQWAAFGECMTTLTDNIPLTREVSPRLKAVYAVPLKQLTPTRLIATAGTVTDSRFR